MSTAELLTDSSVTYVYNKQGTVRAPVPADLYEILLDVKLVPQSYATSEHLSSLGGQAAEARSAGFELSFKSAQSLGIETLNEVTGQWRVVPSSTTYAVVASFPN